MSEALWALGRGTGVVALILFTISIVLGIITRSGRPAITLPRFGVTLLHRNASLLGSIFVVIHIISLFFDPYSKLTFIDSVVPFLGTVKPFWLGLGTVAFDLALALVITGLLRQRIGQKAFRFIHWFSYAMWPIALIHSIGNGTDAGTGWFIALAVLCTGTVVGCTIWRLTPSFIEYSDRRPEEVPK
jgi:sulfoxide reductase heme-binding subunit YedZ